MKKIGLLLLVLLALSCGRDAEQYMEEGNAYLRRGDLTYEILDGWWTDAGTFESLFRAACRVTEGGANHL